MLMNVARSPRILAAANRDRDPSRQAKLTRHAGPVTWAVAGAVSLTLFCLVVAQLDVNVLATAADEVSPVLVGTGVVLFVVESLFSAIRMYLIADRRNGMLTAMRVTAWHGVWLMALPMRLGEVAWMIAMRRAYGWNLATAVACAGVQRLLDMAIVSACLLLTMPLVVGLHENRLPALLGLAGALCLLALIGSTTLHVWLHLAARLVIVTGCLLGHRMRLLRQLNQARHWLRNVRHRRVIRRCLVPTMLGWTAIMTAYWTLGRAVGLPLSPAESSFAAAGSNLVTALPVQTIGGFGLLEAGFTGLVTWVGAPTGTAALAALAIRFASLAAAGLFWLIAVGLIAIPLPNRAAEQSP